MSKKAKAKSSAATRFKIDDQANKVIELEAQLNNERKVLQSILLDI